MDCFQLLILRIFAANQQIFRLLFEGTSMPSPGSGAVAAARRPASVFKGGVVPLGPHAAGQRTHFPEPRFCEKLQGAKFPLLLGRGG